MTILVVEDEEAVRGFVVQVLQLLRVIVHLKPQMLIMV